MWTKSLGSLALLVAVAATAAPSARATNCSLALTASSKTEWRVACEDEDASVAATEFDPSLLTSVRVGKWDEVELSPKTAPQPVQVLLPTTIARVGELISPTLKAFMMQRDTGIRVTPVITFEPTAFAKMTALESLNLGFYNISVDGAFVVPPSLNELVINHGGLADLKLKAVKGASLNLTRVDLRYNKLVRIPHFVFTTKSLKFVDLYSNELPRLRLSRRKFARLLRLIAAKRILLGTIADFTDACEDGEKKTVTLGASSYLVCVIAKEEDDGDVLSDADDADASGSTASSSSSSSAATESSASSSTGSTDAPTAAPQSSDGSATSTAPEPVSSTPAPSSASALVVATPLVVAVASALVFA